MKAKLLFTSAICLLTSYMYSQSLWTQKANFGGIARWNATGFSIGTKGYIGTGYDGVNSFDDFWEWNQATDVWTQKANFAGGVRNCAVGFSIGSNGYIGTGRTSVEFSDFWEYNPSANTWTQKANFPGTARHIAVGFSIGTKGYIGTGNEAPGFAKDFWEWDSQTNTWTQKADFGGTARYWATGFSLGNKGYIGTGNDGVRKSDFWEWDQSTNTWTQKSNFPGTAREGATGFSIGTKGYIGIGSTTPVQNDFWEWDQMTDTWTQVMNFGGVARVGSVSFSIGSKGYCGTGTGPPMKDFWEYDTQSSNLLCGKIYADTNSNCMMDTGEDSLVNWFVKAESATSTLYGSTNNNGTYKIWTPTGTYTVSLIPKIYWQQICPAFPQTYTTTVALQDTITNLDFGADISVFCPDLTVSIGTTTQRRCLTNNYYQVQYWNNGTVAASNATLTVTFDSKIIPLNSTIAWSNVLGNSYLWNIGSVQPGQYVSFSIQDSVSCNATLGDTLLVSAVIAVAGDCDGGNNMDEYNSIVTGSYDPNAKEATTTSNKINIKQANILPTDTINYIIQFQNTGTDTAFKVVVYDTLDADLNIPTVISGVSSHPYTFQLIGTGIIKWTFNNILLPDSNINEAASHGFVKFQILQKPNNPNGTVIKNWAGIVFDFNTPVITDTVVLTVNTPASVQDVKVEEDAISIYPNPTSGIFQITSAGSTSLTTGLLRITNIEVVNVLGEKVYERQLIMDNGQLSISNSPLSIDLSSQPSGIYFLHVKTPNGTAVKKIVKE